MTALAPTLEAFFTERLMRQRQASPNTVAAYRDGWRLLLGFAASRIGKQPSELDVADLDAPLIGAFLEHLEIERHNSPRTRNARLAAIRSFFRFAALCHPEHAAVIARVLAIPTKRCDRAVVSFLTEAEADALLASPDQTTWTGRRDQALLLVALQTGLRVSELTGLANKDLELRAGAHVRCWGKGRKERCTPLRRSTVLVLQAWTKERGGGPDDPLFPTRRGTRLSRDAVEALVDRHAATAARAAVAAGEERDAARAAALLRHGAAARRGRPRRSGSMARPRASRDDRHLLARRSVHQGDGARPHPATSRPSRPLPASRPPARLPFGPLIMPPPPTRLS
jgi:site-specific recombinase XerD